MCATICQPSISPVRACASLPLTVEKRVERSCPRWYQYSRSSAHSATHATCPTPRSWRRAGEKRTVSPRVCKAPPERQAIRPLPRNLKIKQINIFSFEHNLRARSARWFSKRCYFFVFFLFYSEPKAVSSSLLTASAGPRRASAGRRSRGGASSSPCRRASLAPTKKTLIFA